MVDKKNDSDERADHQSNVQLGSTQGVTSGEPKQRRRHTLPRELRFKESAEFNHARRRGRRVHTQRFIVYVVDNAKRATRLGLTVSKKVGKAYHRAYVKRLTREAFRRSELRHTVGFDVSLIAKKDIPTPTLSELIVELNQLASGQKKPKRHDKRRDKGRPKKRDSKTVSNHDQKTEHKYQKKRNNAPKSIQSSDRSS